MTNEEALEEAKRLWGENAWVSFDTRVSYPYEVHKNLKTDGGAGLDWEDAFQDARQ